MRRQRKARVLRATWILVAVGTLSACAPSAGRRSGNSSADVLVWTGVDATNSVDAGEACAPPGQAWCEGNTMVVCREDGSL